jgi:hypothetical protein
MGLEEEDQEGIGVFPNVPDQCTALEHGPINAIGRPPAGLFLQQRHGDLDRLVPRRGEGGFGLLGLIGQLAADLRVMGRQQDIARAGQGLDERFSPRLLGVNPGVKSGVAAEAAWAFARGCAGAGDWRLVVFFLRAIKGILPGTHSSTRISTHGGTTTGPIARAG